MWPPVQWNDACVVVRLDNHHHVSGSLDDLGLRGDAAWNFGWSGVSGDAASVQTSRCHINADFRAFGCGLGLSFPCLRRQRRNSPVWWIHNQRRAQVGSDAALPGVHPIFLPVIVNRSRIDLRVSLDRPLERGECFLFRIEWLFRNLSRALQGRIAAVVKVVALEIRIAPWRTRRS